MRTDGFWFCDSLTLDVDLSKQQPPGPTCGVVAAAIAARLSQPGWRTADVTWAANPPLVDQACTLLDLPQDHFPARGLTTLQVASLYRARSDCASLYRARSDCAALFDVIPVDKLVDLMRSDLKAHASVVRIRAVNTCPSDMCFPGHWFTVAYAVKKLYRHESEECGGAQDYVGYYHCMFLLSDNGVALHHVTPCYKYATGPFSRRRTRIVR